MKIELDKSKMKDPKYFKKVLKEAEVFLKDDPNGPQKIEALKKVYANIQARLKEQSNRPLMERLYKRLQLYRPTSKFGKTFRGLGLSLIHPHLPQK